MCPLVANAHFQVSEAKIQLVKKISVPLRAFFGEMRSQLPMLLSRAAVPVLD